MVPFVELRRAETAVTHEIYSLKIKTIKSANKNTNLTIYI